MYRPLLRGLLIALCATPGVATPPPDLRLVSTVWPPFTDVAGGTRRANDLVHEALRRAGVVAETAIVTDDRLIPSLSDGSFAGSGALWFSAERESFLQYSQAYMETRLVLVGRKGSSVSATSLADLAGKRVALVKTWAYGPTVEEATATIFVGGDSMESNLRAVLDGSVDYTIIDDLVIRYIVDQYPQEAKDRLEIGTTALVTRPLYFALRKDLPRSKEIVRRFNDEIRGMLLDGSYNRILGLTWIEADTDGDGVTELVLGGDRAGLSPPTDAYAIVSEATPPKKLRFLIGGDLYKDWESVPQHYKVPLEPPPGVEPGEAEPLFKIKF